MTTLKWPKAFLIDLDNTLHDYRAAARLARLALASKIEAQVEGVPRDAIMARYEAILKEKGEDIHKSGRELRMQRTRRLLCTWPQTRSFEPEPFVAALESALLDAVRPFGGALEAFGELAKKAPAIVVTEGYGDIQGAIARRLGIPADSGNFLAAYAHGVRKFNGTAYRLALKWLRLEAENVVMIGDNWAWDIVAASEAGIWPLWVRGSNPPPARQPVRYLGSVAFFGDVPAFMAPHWDAKPRPYLP